MAGQAFYENQGYVYRESGQRTSDPAFTGDTIHVSHHQGITFIIDISDSDTISATYTVQYQDPIGEDWSTLLASAAQTGNGTIRLTVGPGVTTVANVSLNTYVPPIVRLICAGTATDITDSVYVVKYAV